MNTQQPTIGRTVIYTLSQQDADEINRRRVNVGFTQSDQWPVGAQAHVGNNAYAGAEYPAVVVAAFDPVPGYETERNLKVLLDGNDEFWATSRVEGDGPGQWHWSEQV